MQTYVPAAPRASRAPATVVVSGSAAKYVAMPSTPLKHHKPHPNKLGKIPLPEGCSLSRFFNPTAATTKPLILIVTEYQLNPQQGEVPVDLPSPRCFQNGASAKDKSAQETKGFRLPKTTKDRNKKIPATAPYPRQGCWKSRRSTKHPAQGKYYATNASKETEGFRLLTNFRKRLCQDMHQDIIDRNISIHNKTKTNKTYCIRQREES